MNEYLSKYQGRSLLESFINGLREGCFGAPTPWRLQVHFQDKDSVWHVLVHFVVYLSSARSNESHMQRDRTLPCLFIDSLQIFHVTYRRGLCTSLVDKAVTDYGRIQTQKNNNSLSIWKSPNKNMKKVRVLNLTKHDNNLKELLRFSYFA